MFTQLAGAVADCIMLGAGEQFPFPMMGDQSPDGGS